MPIKHSLQTAIHKPYAAIYADAAERTVATGFIRGEGGTTVTFDSSDLYKKVLQLDDASEWILTAITPTWVQMNGAATLADGSVTLAKLADLAQATVIGRASGAGTGVPTALSAAQLKTLLALASGDISDFAEAVEDRIGAILTDNSDLDWAYNDGAGTEVATVKSGASALNPAFTTLTDGATVTWATAGARVNNAKVTLGGNRTLDITGEVDGASGLLIVIQDGTGSRTLTLPGSSKVIGGGAGAITLSTAAGSIDILSWVYDGTNFYWTKGLNYT